MAPMNSTSIQQHLTMLTTECTTLRRAATCIRTETSLMELLNETTAVVLQTSKNQTTPYYFVDAYTSYMVETVINVGVISAITVIGVGTNVVNMFIFFKQGLRDRINLCLFSLALADAGYLLSLFAYKSFSILTLISPDVGAYWKIQSLNTVIGVYWGFSSTSNVLTMIVALERCVCVVSPFKAKKFLKTRTMLVTIVLVYIFILGSSGIFDVKFVVGTRRDAARNSTVYFAAESPFYLTHRMFVNLVYNYLLAIFIPTTSLIVVILCTATTVVRLRLTMAWRRESITLSTAERKEAGVTKMLIAVCYVYVICVTPSVINAFVVEFVSDWLPTGRYSNLFYVYVALMHMLSALNCSLSFFIYYARGSKFRESVHRLIGGRD